MSYYLLQWFLLTHSKSLVVGGNSWSRSWDISLYNFGQQLAQSFPFSPKQDFLGNFTKVIFITRYKLAWCWTIVEPNLPIWRKRDFFERDVFGIFRYMIFINLISPIMLKTLNKLEKWNMKLKLARFSATIRPTLLIWSKRKRIFWEIPESDFYLLIFHYEATKFEKLELYMSGKLEDILRYKVA